MTPQAVRDEPVAFAEWFDAEHPVTPITNLSLRYAQREMMRVAWEAARDMLRADAGKDATIGGLKRELIETRAALYDEQHGITATLRNDRNEARDAELAELRKALLKCRDGFASFPRSLGYEYTHLPMIDRALTAAANPVDEGGDTK